MQAAAKKIEAGVERAASACFAAACCYAAYMWFVGFTAQPVLGAETAAAAAVAYLCCRRVLASIDGAAPAHPVPIFDLRTLDSTELPELLLTDEAGSAAAATGEPLLLDDVLAELEPDSRVVRLFDPAAMPTPAELRSRIDRHLEQSDRTAETSDATQALHDALAELRRAIR